jgi:hypothetical protein
MNRSRRTVLVVVCAALAVALTASAVATAAYKKGKYEGTTSQGHAINFKAKKLGVKNFAFTVDVPCNDGSVQALRATGAQAPTNDKGKFKAVFTGLGTTVAKGKLKRKQAEGTIKSTGVVNEVTGASCPTNSVNWSAKKQ